MQSVRWHEKDNKNDYNRFKLLAGENYKIIFDKGKECSMHIMDIIAANPFKDRYDEFIQACQNRMEQNGENTNFKEDIDLADIKEEFKDAIKMYEHTNQTIKDYMDKEISIKLKTIDVAKVPINITGSYLNAIKGMINS